MWRAARDAPVVYITLDNKRGCSGRAIIAALRQCMRHAAIARLQGQAADLGATEALNGASRQTEVPSCPAPGRCAETRRLKIQAARRCCHITGA